MTGFTNPVLEMTTLFLGSSTAAKSQAKALAAALTNEQIDFLPWWEAFTPGRTLLEELNDIRGRVSGALLIFSPEAKSEVRGKEVWTPNLNVLFEFGYFYGHFKKKNVAMVRYGNLYLPSDFDGYIHITGSKFFKRGAITKPSKRTIVDFGRWVQSAGFEKTLAKPIAAGVQVQPSARGSEDMRRMFPRQYDRNWKVL